ncbi:hypothetical protein M8J76_015972 [Diaphorina citri]|nr:hypothetical protein M8J75_015289 [Diaphorina citri]KAI5724136.1 hypothetical protein M8J76_015972 [Diaphorina citri]KAI5728829.1 hypothetical protein M8J77_021732 [Diaphorina citri]
MLLSWLKRLLAWIPTEWLLNKTEAYILQNFGAVGAYSIALVSKCKFKGTKLLKVGACFFIYNFLCCHCSG